MNSAAEKNRNKQIISMKKLLVLSAAAALLAVQSATAVPTLIISDNNGNTTTLIGDNGAGDANPAVGAITFIGSVGNWTINVTTGLASPPGPGHSPSQPSIDLNSVNQFAGGAGGTLTIVFTADNLGPISGILNHKTGGTQTGLTSAQFIAGVNGTDVTHQTVTTSPFGVSQSGAVSTGTGATISITAVLTAGRGPALTSFDSEVTVPDAGMTLALLGSGLTGLAFFARRKTA